MILTILFCTMSMHTMCILFASYARLESLQAKNWALSRCRPRGPVGENIYPLHRGTFVERLEHHCHGGSLPVLAGRDGGSGSRISCYVSFPQFLGWIFVAHHSTTAWDRVQALFHVSVVGSIFSRMVVILAVNTSNFHEFSLLVHFRAKSNEEFAPISIWWRNRGWLWALQKRRWFYGLQVLVEHWGSGDCGDVCIICIP